MSQDPVIRFQNVSKRFALDYGKQRTVVEALNDMLARRKRAKRNQELWAVNDVSFDVYPGQCLGLIGRNGSGKSTTLKLISRILRPTSGRIVVDGRVSALLELGAGFHPDLTGKENIFLNASVLGLSKQDILACYDDIVAFSELDEFINMPVKHYSSGMYMRLGFSVAIHVNPDILIVDEILAVGDQAFQEKCIEQIYDMKNAGVTIVMVSHNLNIMRNLCSHMVWVEHGKVQSAGPVEEVVGKYMAFAHGREVKETAPAAGDNEFQRWGSREIELTAVRFMDSDGRESRDFKTGDEMTIEMDYLANEPVLEPEFGMAINRHDGIQVSRPNSHLAQMPSGTFEGAGTVRYHIDRLPLLPARYNVTAAVYNSRRQSAYDHHEQAYSFRVVAGGTREIYGLVELPAAWEWQPGN